MATKFSELETIVRANLDDTSANVDQCIDDAIDYLSNFFSLYKIDVSQSTVISEKTLEIPAGSKKITSVRLGDDFIERAGQSARVDSEKYDLQKYFESFDSLNFTQEFNEVLACEITYNSKFTRLLGAANSETDVPEELQPLLTLYATYFYYLIMLSKIALNREDYPDIEPKELKDFATQWKLTADDLMQLIHEKSNII